MLNGTYSADVQAFKDRTGTTSRTVNIPSSLSESGNASFAAQGLVDVPFMVQGKTIEIPLSKINPYLQTMGFLLLGLAYLASLKIVGIT